jgi:hypothetical protein
LKHVAPLLSIIEACLLLETIFLAKPAHRLHISWNNAQLFEKFLIAVAKLPSLNVS